MKKTITVFLTLILVAMITVAAIKFQSIKEWTLSLLPTTTITVVDTEQVDSLEDELAAANLSLSGLAAQLNEKANDIASLQDAIAAIQATSNSEIEALTAQLNSAIIAMQELQVQLASALENVDILENELTLTARKIIVVNAGDAEFVTLNSDDTVTLEEPNYQSFLGFYKNGITLITPETKFSEGDIIIARYSPITVQISLEQMDSGEYIQTVDNVIISNLVVGDYYSSYASIFSEEIQKKMEQLQIVNYDEIGIFYMGVNVTASNLDFKITPDMWAAEWQFTLLPEIEVQIFNNPLVGSESIYGVVSYSIGNDYSILENAFFTVPTSSSAFWLQITPANGYYAEVTQFGMNLETIRTTTTQNEILTVSYAPVTSGFLVKIEFSPIDQFSYVYTGTVEELWSGQLNEGLMSLVTYQHGSEPTVYDAMFSVIGELPGDMEVYYMDPINGSGGVLYFSDLTTTNIVYGLIYCIKEPVLIPTDLTFLVEGNGLDYQSKITIKQYDGETLLSTTRLDQVDFETIGGIDEYHLAYDSAFSYKISVNVNSIYGLISFAAINYDESTSENIPLNEYGYIVNFSPVGPAIIQLTLNWAA